MNSLPLGEPANIRCTATTPRRPTIKYVDWVLAVGSMAGAAVGLAAGLGFRVSERAQHELPPEPEDPLPPGAEQVLAVLSASAVIVDPQSRVVRASPSAYAFGLVRNEALVVPELVAMVEAVRRDGRIRQLDLDLPRGREGTLTLFVHVRVAPLSSELVLVLVEDRTKAHRIDEVRRDFVANVSHELKTPVGALGLLAEAVEEASEDPEAIRRFALRMQSESARLTRLVQEIIDLSRLQYDDPLDAPEVVKVDDVVAEALDRARVDAESQRIRLASGGTAGLEVWGNASQLIIAIGNLVENAVAYSPEGTRVAVGVRQVLDQVEISVTDQGIGIPATEQDRIFERFYRVDPARSRATGGTGLGLAIVKHVVAAHGGEIRVWSVEGTGSTFTVLLPQHRSTEGQSAPSPAPVPEATS